MKMFKMTPKHNGDLNHLFVFLTNKYIEIVNMSHAFLESQIFQYFLLKLAILCKNYWKLIAANNWCRRISQEKLKKS